jgi:hypothetical protein
MKESYETPKVVTEKIEGIGSLVGSPGGEGENPIQQLQPYFGLCCS